MDVKFSSHCSESRYSILTFVRPPSSTHPQTHRGVYFPSGWVAGSSAPRGGVTEPHYTRIIRPPFPMVTSTASIAFSLPSPSPPNVIFRGYFASRYAHETREIVSEEGPAPRDVRGEKLGGSHCCIGDRDMIAKSPISWNAGWPIQNAVIAPSSSLAHSFSLSALHIHYILFNRGSGVLHTK